MLLGLGRKHNQEKIRKTIGIPLERLFETLKISQTPVSLSTPIGEVDDSSLGEFLEDQNSPNLIYVSSGTILKKCWKKF